MTTCTSLELDAALDEGYRVTKVFRVLEYKRSDDKLFRPYIAEFMAQKIQASGFSANIRGNAQLEAKFVDECLEMFDITIDSAKMVANKGLRMLSKLMLNNLWGKFSMRNSDLAQTLITDDPAKLGEYLDDATIDVMAVDELNEENALITFVKKKEFVEEHECSNVGGYIMLMTLQNLSFSVISLWTTAAARLHLLRAMQQVVRSPGCTLLYTDTDSLIYVHPRGANPLRTGPHLGQFTDEYPEHEIVEYCSGGAKQVIFVWKLCYLHKKIFSMDFGCEERTIRMRRTSLC